MVHSIAHFVILGIILNIMCVRGAAKIVNWVLSTLVTQPVVSVSMDVTIIGMETNVIRNVMLANVHCVPLIIIYVRSVLKDTILKAILHVSLALQIAIRT